VTQKWGTPQGKENSSGVEDGKIRENRKSHSEGIESSEALLQKGGKLGEDRRQFTTLWGFALPGGGKE